MACRHTDCSVGSQSGVYIRLLLTCTDNSETG